MEQFPEGLREALARADEDYLMGLSNKGTVNRGKKDLQGYSPLVRIQGRKRFWRRAGRPAPCGLLWGTASVPALPGESAAT